MKEKKEKLNNFPAYNRYNSESGDYFCTQQDFCVFLEKEFPGLKTAEGYERIYSEIKEKWIDEKTVEVSNRGTYDTDYSVLRFEYVPHKNLCDFQCIHLHAGETKTVNFV